MTAIGSGSYHPDYARLAAYLTARDEQQVTLTFAQLEQAILLAPLPYGARSQTSGSVVMLMVIGCIRGLVAAAGDRSPTVAA
jgi:hypothetical protein